MVPQPCSTSSVTRAAVLVSVTLLVSVQLSRAQAPSCGRAGVGPAPLISSDSIGPLDLHHTVAELRAACPSARDTMLLGGEESSAFGLVFLLGSVTVVAQQVIGDTSTGLRGNLPADMWTVMGSSARLPYGLTIGSRWQELRAAYGPGVADADNDVETWVRFCPFPRILFVLSAKLSGHHVYTYDLASIPDNTSVKEVVVLDQFLARTGHEWRRFVRACSDRASP